MQDPRPKISADLEQPWRPKPHRESSSLSLPPPPVLQPRQGELRYHHDVGSPWLTHRRRLVVYLPPGYETERHRRYPVIYFHDGQNIFDPATAAYGTAWRADLIAERLLRAGRLPPVLMVGVDNTPARHDEYTLHHDGQRKEGGLGHLYGRFLFEEVKPLIDAEYRTLPGREDTTLIGSSLGGLITLSLGWKHPDMFANCGALSPSLWWCGGQLLKEWEKSDLDWMRSLRFWVDMGTRESSLRRALHPGMVRLRWLQELFDRASLVPGRDYYYQEVAGGEHNEASWAARLDKVLLFFLGNKR